MIKSKVVRLKEGVLSFHFTTVILYSPWNFGFVNYIFQGFSTSIANAIEEIAVIY